MLCRASRIHDLASSRAASRRPFSLTLDGWSSFGLGSSFGEESIVLEPLAGRESHMIARAAQADALVLVPPGDEELSAGETVRFLRL